MSRYSWFRIVIKFNPEDLPTIIRILNDSPIKWAKWGYEDSYEDSFTEDDGFLCFSCVENNTNHAGFDDDDVEDLVKALNKEISLYGVISWQSEINYGRYVDYLFDGASYTIESESYLNRFHF